MLMYSYIGFIELTSTVTSLGASHMSYRDRETCYC